MDNDLEKEIHKVVVFFDMFDFPLTALELWQFLPVKCEYADVLDALEHTNQLEMKQGFYCLPGRTDLVRVRLDRYNHAQRKFKRALKVARFFALIPFVEMAAIGNLIGPGNCRDQSDIDFFIITRPGRIWLTRLVASGAMKLLNLRPRPRKKRDTICLSFYAVSSALDLSRTRLDDDDIYFRYWLAGLHPIFDRRDFYASLIRENAWLGRELPNWRAKSVNWPHKLDAFAGPAGGAFADLAFGWLEGPARAFEKAIMPKQLKTAMNKSTNCLVNDNILKLFTTDRRAEIRRNYESRING